ncbi:MAG: peptidoglycan DD-metalloendopeptidase family protein [Bacteroidota bacterium]
MFTKKTLFLLLLFINSIPIGISIYAQKPKSREELEARKKENIRQIAEIKNILNKTTNKKEANLGQLKAINKQVSVKVKQIELINQDLNSLSAEIKELIKINAELTNEYIKLKKEYGQMIYSGSKSHNNFTSLNFLFSSESFNQLFLRYNYLKQIAKARQKQAIEIDKIIVELKAKQTALQNKKKQQKGVLTERVEESKDLEQIKTKQQQITEKLIQKEGELKKQLAERKRAVKQLENLISNMIEKEIKRTRKVENSLSEKKTESKTDKKETGIKELPDEGENSNTIKMNSSEANISSAFSAAKARLPWPVRSGFISEAFGSHPHEVLKGITVPNDGIEIQTNTGEAVRSVFDGTVMVVDNSIIGMGSVVAIQHGNYFTIYGKLRNVSVEAGQKVKARDSIGTVMEGKDGTSEVQFQVWKNTIRQNPEKWLLHR